MLDRAPVAWTSRSRGRRRGLLFGLFALAGGTFCCLPAGCGGTNGHEDLPSPAGSNPDAGDASNDATFAGSADASGLSEPFDVVVPTADRELPDVVGLDGPPSSQVYDAAGAADGASCCPDTTSPCTAACCGPNGVRCWSSEGGVCTPTEAFFVNIDIDAGNFVVVADGGADGGPALEPTPYASSGVGSTTGSCYGCLVNADCIDDLQYGDVDKECGDLITFDTATLGGPVYPVDGTDPTTLCLGVMSCMFASGCATGNPTTPCLCGSESGPSCRSNPGNGPCAQLEVDGLPLTTGTLPVCLSQYHPQNPNPMCPNYAPVNLGPMCTEGDPTQTVNTFFEDTALPAGMANTLLGCAVINCASNCNLE